MYRKTAEWSNLLFVYKKLDELFIVPVSLSDEVGCEVFMYNTVHTLVAVDVLPKSDSYIRDILKLISCKCCWLITWPVSLEFQL